jgi:excisionase family DNA binding protein
VSDRAPVLETLLTVEQVAELLAFKPSTIRAYCEQRKLPHVRIGGQLRFRPSELHEWLEQRSSRPITRRRRSIVVAEHSGSAIA